MSNYEQWQIEKYGDFIPETNEPQDFDAETFTTREEAEIYNELNPE
jgi:hypothetical protein